jgi:Fe-S-cluster containining protein
MSQTQQFWQQLGFARLLEKLLPEEFQSYPAPSIVTIDCFQCRKVIEELSTPQVKCCDIVPKLRNFQAGAILAQNKHPVLLRWLSEKRADPYAIHIPPVLAQQYTDARQDGKAGLPCPLLKEEEEAFCSIYANRPAMCIGYHCVYPNALQREFWSCLQHTLELWQDAVSRTLVWTSDLDRQKTAQFWEEWEGSIWQKNQQQPAAYTAFWQHWEGRELEFFLDCAQRLQGWDTKDCTLLRELQGQQILARGHEFSRATPDDLWKGMEEGIKASRPPSSLRERYRDGEVPYADETHHFLHEQESWLLWYLEELEQERQPRWWKKFSLW